MPGMDQVTAVIDWIANNFLWAILAWVLLAAGIFFCIRTGAVQFRFFGQMFRAVTEKTDRTETAPEGDRDSEARRRRFSGRGGLSSFKSFTISAASRVGTGNIAGVALAISVGGPGTIFWMWVIAIVGGATAFVESTLGQLYKSKSGGEYHGGPAFYMSRGLRLGWLSPPLVVAIVLTYGFVYEAIQTNSIVEAVSYSIGRDTVEVRIIIGLVIALMTSVVIFGGLRRIANVTQVIVPFMAAIYIAIGILVVVANIDKVPDMFATIVGSALGFKEIAGASIWLAFTNGMQRGLFSNEAGQGSVPNAAATATVSHPAKQGLVQTLGVYFDTLLVCSITAFIILLSGAPVVGEPETSTLTQSALAATTGEWGAHAITVILFFLAFSSVLGNFYLAQANLEYFTESHRIHTFFRGFVVVAVFLGALGSIPLVWALGDMFAATMVFINLVAIVPLAGVAVRLLKNYRAQKKAGLDPVFHRSMMPDLKGIECWDGTDEATFDGEERARVMRERGIELA